MQTWASLIEPGAMHWIPGRDDPFVWALNPAADLSITQFCTRRSVSSSFVPFVKVSSIHT